MIEVLQTIAMLCQIYTGHTGSIYSALEKQQQCHAKLAKCVEELSPGKTPSSALFYCVKEHK